MKKLLLTGLVLTMITSCNTTINSNNISSSSVNTTSSSSKVISSSQVQYKNALEEFNGNTSLDFDFKVLVELLKMQKEVLDKETFEALLESVKTGVSAELDRLKD